MDLNELKDWMRERRIGDVSCLTPDMGGAARGKNMTPGLFLSSLENKSLRIPEGTYTIGTKKALKSSLELQQFHMPLVYLAVRVRVVQWDLNGRNRG